ncbi:MAG: hypothetical protein ACRC6I_02265 [Paracoccaceae bacterium]
MVRIGWRAAKCALILPFLLLSLIPVGLMPARAADGAMVLVLCTGDGAVEVTVTPEGSDQHAVAGTCDWAAQGAAAAPVEPFNLDARAAQFAEAAWTRASNAALAAQTAARPFPTGPPATF